ncbi:MAG: hypothetical protein O6826_10495 [Acidobacteria bacterium]|nr:hypothetical protein [Acidobacteriota bacterium]
MMSYPVFKVLHLIGVFMVLVSLGGLIVLGAAGELNHSRWRKLAALTNGIGLAVVFIGGFGLLGLLQLGWPWPGWIFSKIFIWLLFGVMMVLAKRAPESGKYLWWGSLLLAGVAAYLANLKPF